jgi:hypothetical protein
MTERARAPNVASPGVRQDDVYGEVFARAASVPPVSGRLYVATLAFGRTWSPSTRSRSKRREAPMHGLWR